MDLQRPVEAREASLEPSARAQLLAVLRPSPRAGAALAFAAAGFGLLAAASAYDIMRGYQVSLNGGSPALELLVAVIASVACVGFIAMRDVHLLTPSGIEVRRAGRLIEAIRWDHMFRVRLETFNTPSSRALIVTFLGTDSSMAIGLVDNFDWHKGAKLRFLHGLLDVGLEEDRLDPSLVSLLRLWERASSWAPKESLRATYQGTQIRLAYRELARGQLWEAQSAFKRALGHGAMQDVDASADSAVLDELLALPPRDKESERWMGRVGRGVAVFWLGLILFLLVKYVVSFR